MHAIDRALERTSMQWSVVVRDAGSGAVLLDHDGGRVLRAASIGKLILLAFVGNVLVNDPAAGRTLLDRRVVAPVSDSGIWQHLSVDALPVADVAKLVFLASDNLATNVLAAHFELESVRAFRAELGLARTDLLDVVRDVRGRSHPDTLSRACARELSDFMMRIARGRAVNAGLSRWLYNGLSLSMDLSMVPATFGLDPLARGNATDSRAVPLVANKTGSDAGVRGDTGIISLGSRDVAYAVICNYDQSPAADAEAVRLMQSIGGAILDECATS